MDTIKTFLANRITQLIARYLSTGLVALAAYLGVTLDSASVQTTVTVAGTLIAAGISAAVDHCSHSLQKTADAAAPVAPAPVASPGG